MEIKTNKVGNFTIKDITAEQLTVLFRVMEHVRLGQGEASEAAFEFLQAVEAHDDAYGAIDDLTVSATVSDDIEDLDLHITNPTLEVYFG
jgi:hypothetical protein